jgi:NDP-sugar pyrophosphorylase family protein
MLNILVLSGGKGNRFTNVLNHGCKALAKFNNDIWIEIILKLFKDHFNFNFNIFLNISIQHSLLKELISIDKNNINIIAEPKREGVLNGIFYSSKYLSNNKYSLVILGDVIFEKDFIEYLNIIVKNLEKKRSCFKSFDDKNDLIAIGRPKRMGNDFEIFSYKDFKLEDDLQVGGALICSTEKLKKLSKSETPISSFYQIIEAISNNGKINVLKFVGLFEDFGTEDRYNKILK